MKTGRVPFIVRRFVQTKATSVGPGSASTSASSGCSFIRWITTFRITAPPLLSTRVVEVDRQPNATRGNPDTQPDAVVLRVHEVHVVAAAVRPLGLEEQVRAQDRLEWIARAAAEVLGPDVARVAGPTQPIAGRSADEVV